MSNPYNDYLASEEAFKVVQLPPAKRGRAGKTPKHVSEAMASALTASSNPDAAIRTEVTAVTPNLKAWAAERGLKFTTRGESGKRVAYLIKA